MSSNCTEAKRLFFSNFGLHPNTVLEKAIWISNDLELKALSLNDFSGYLGDFFGSPW
ncbi:MAG: hypothetical protein HKN76_07515 [Saprospiraceae bacterium]|nr:hypothetical protein [Saprospiraceae bacterium]